MLPHQVVLRRHRGRRWLCWNYTGYVDTKGYGVIQVARRKYKAHRYAWFLARGTWPRQDINHLCENKRCVNPAHMEDVPRRANIMYSPTQAAARNARKTHCQRGHPYPQYQPGVKRYCKICMLARYYERRAA